MRKLLALLAVLCLLVAACSSDPTASTGDGDPTGQETGAGNGNGDGDGNGNGQGENGDGGEDVEGNDPPPQVEPSIPGEGESTAIAFEVLRSGTDPDEGELSRPSMALARNEGAGESAAAASPAVGAAEAIRSWTDYTGRAVIAVFGGAQPDTSYAIRVTDVSVTEGGEVLSVFAQLRVRDEAASQVISVPWTVITVEAGAAVLAVRCVLATEGQGAIESRC